MITISYRLLTDRVISTAGQVETVSVVIPAATVFELPAGLDPGPNVEAVRRRFQERKVA